MQPASGGMRTSVGGAESMNEYSADTKRCTKCGESKLNDAFAKDKNRRDGLQPWCRVCHGKNRAERYWGDEVHRAKQREHWREYHSRPEVQARKNQQKRENTRTERERARDTIATAVKRGKIPPASTLACLNCGHQATQYHHFRGYERQHWRDVIPLCRECHGKEHWNNGQPTFPILESVA